MRQWNTGAALALGVGTGAALAASMGPVGFALGIGLWLGIAGIRRRRGADGC